MISIDRLIDIYNSWCEKENIELGSADEILMLNENLTDKQISWLKRFIEVWDYAQDKEVLLWGDQIALRSSKKKRFNKLLLMIRIWIRMVRRK